MISKNEWHEWKQHKITQKLVELVKQGQEVAIGELVGSRGEVGDFHRGVIFEIDDIVDTIQKGNYIYMEEEE